MKNEINEAHEAVEDNSTDSSNSSEPVERRPIVPGEVIVSGEDFLPGDGTRRDGENVLANRFGLAEISGRVVKVIPIFGAFIPRKGNVIIGRVADINFSGWMIDIDYASSAFLGIEECPRFINRNEMDQFLAIGDVIAAKIWGVKSKGIDLTLKGKGLGKLEGGFIFRTIPSRVPRVIGREGSMITLVKEKTSCQITVGQNGWIWIKGEKIEDEIKARKAIEFIASQVLVSGLTEKMEEWFENN
ncbi:RNA-binding protein [Candidatus Pacearchaeota archaeon]|jgi:exosome complex component RRP4|nr:RNA-binding protein [Candidatus Pacearchaeota archaeon]|tara:strand:+ start:11780 stop:12511 length:732 start_codon:yes stop_codon:yes gene_type:complete